MVKQHGRKGIYRGMLAGSISIFTRNGFAMIVLQYMQRKFTELGYRK